MRDNDVCVPCFDIYNELALNAYVIRVTLEILVPESFVSTTQNFVVRSTRFRVFCQAPFQAPSRAPSAAVVSGSVGGFQNQRTSAAQLAPRRGVALFIGAPGAD